MTFRSIIIFIKRNVQFIRIEFSVLNETVTFSGVTRGKKKAGKDVSGKERMVPHCSRGRTSHSLRTKMQLIMRNTERRGKPNIPIP